MIVLIILLLIQILMLCTSFILSLKTNEKVIRENIFLSNEDIPDVIITAKESVETISDCIKSLTGLTIRNIYICLDNPLPQNVIELERIIPDNCYLIQNKDCGGKINTQIKGVNVSSAHTILLLDADIRLINNKRDFEEMLLFKRAHSIDFLCPYSFGINLNSSCWGSISECDRILRQRVIRSGRDYFGLSNLSGYFLLADRKKYIKIARQSLQDDVIATINILKNGFKVKTYPKVVCGELEHTLFYKHLNQRVRWTVGNIKALPNYFKVFPQTGLIKGCIFLTTPYLWYTSAYVTFASLITLIFYFNPLLFILVLAEILLKTLMIIFVSGKKNIIAIFLYAIIWPFFITMALILSLPYALFNWEKASRR